MKQFCSDSWIIIKYASVGTWRQMNVQSPWNVIRYSLGTVEQKSQCPAPTQCLKWWNSECLSFIGSCYSVCHKKKKEKKYGVNQCYVKSRLVNEKQYDTISALFLTLGTAFFLTWQQMQKKTQPVKATWVWFPISPLTVSSFTSEALYHLVWLPTAPGLVGLKSFFRQQLAFKDSAEGEMMLGRTAKPIQRNVF